MAALMPRLSSAASSASIVSKDAFADGSYCHIKFPAIVERTLASAQPVLKDAWFSATKAGIRVAALASDVERSGFAAPHARTSRSLGEWSFP